MGEVFGLFGHPVGHSMSPLIHNDAFQQLGLTHSYHAFDIAPKNLEKAVEAIRTLNIKGCNVTIPHKVEIMKYLDFIEEEAKQIGAVNTIVNDQGRLIGSNTDGRGYLESLLPSLDRSLSEQDVLIIGAGGAARAIAAVLVKEQVQSITFANRTVEKAEALKVAFDANHRNLAVSSLQEAEQDVPKFSIIINTTSVGMSPKVNERPISLDKVRSNAIVSDLVYNPLETSFLKEARLKGTKIVDGLGMFVNQAALSFQKWTGVEPDRRRMRELVLKQLGGNNVNR
ncbi:shikimate dehydrogenase [Halalkalibacterium ligniniphilum]|uniref:shikimate dehydrogenase n=1 Tax=Halalkalibacterium ligniniphilum TaxID=1134413 RepID=UPI00034A83F8|nr:shikimate dehydrogenase [Halalkalibacterium ligniniphilum]